MATNDLPDITEGAAKRLAAYVAQWDTGETSTTDKLMAELDARLWAVESRHPGATLADVRASVDELMAHLDEREVA